MSAMPEEDSISSYADSIADEVLLRLEKGELTCPDCSNGCGVADYSSRVCPICSGPLLARPVSGKGHIHSFAVFHIQYGPEYSVPHTVLFVELEEGCRLAAVLSDREDSEPHIGDEVRFCGAINGKVQFSLIN